MVIPNWNTKRFLGPCLDSLRGQSFSDFEAIIVDNGSTDGSAGFAEREFPEARTISLGENRGFSAAVNEGIKASDSPLVVLLNSDTEQDPAWLASLVRASEAHPEAGFFASKLVDFHDRGRLDGAGDALRPSGLPYRLGHGERDLGQFDEPSRVFGACAAAAMYRRGMLEDIGLFDEDFGSYCEDADLSFRAQLAGYHCLYVPAAVVRHIGSASTGGSRSAAAARLGTRNSISLLVKNLPLSAVPHVLPFFLLGQLARLLVMAASKETLRAHLDGLAEAKKHLPAMLAKRRVIQSKKRLSDARARKLLRRSSIAAASSMARRLRDRGMDGLR